MQEKGNDQPREVVGLQDSQGDQEEENNSRPANDVFGNCESSQEPEELPNAAEMEGQTTRSDNAEVAEGQDSPSDNVPLAQRLPTVHNEPTIPKETTSGTISQAVSEPTRQNQTKTVPVQPSEKETSRSDNVPMVQSLATVPKEPEKATGSDSTSGKISKAVPESTGQNAMPKIVPDQPSEKVTKARSLFEVFICHYIYVSFVCMSSDEIETMYVCRSLP
jgi:hypothetical protein